MFDNGSAIPHDKLSPAAGVSGQSQVHGGAMFGALTKIFANPPVNFEPDLLANILAERDMTRWGDFVRDQKGGDSRALALQMALIEAMAAGDQTSIAA